jgi:4-amino-4-deoxy-L-arabinose transferase-like glycosyltransferase
MKERLNRGQQKEWLILILCLIIGFALRFYHFDQKSLWIDEVHSFNDARQGIKDQIKYFKEDPSDFLHPPLFYLLTHLFYPFEKPERDLRIFPLIFGILSIPMIYFLAKLFSPPIAFPCAFSLAFMTYHISFSQDGRSYSLIVFLGMAALYFFLKFLRTHKRLDLLFVGFFFSILFYTSYSSIPFILLSQILWFYHPGEEYQKPNISSFLTLNVVILLLCAPWILFLILNYKGQPVVDRIFIENLGSLKQIVLNMLNDWVPGAPLTVISILVLFLFPIFSQNRKNALLLLTLIFSPVLGLYIFCKIAMVNHYFSSRYVINFLPLFLISIFLSLHAMEAKLQRRNSMLRFRVLFLILFIASNITILPLYYRSEKQDFRGLVSYLEGQLQDGDKIFVKSIALIPGILHYFKVYPESRHYNFPVWLDDAGHELLAKVTLIGQKKRFAIHFSSSGYARYAADGGRLWIIVGKPAVKEMKECSACVFKGYFDGAFCNFRKFPSDASMYLFLLDPKSPGEKGIDLPIEQ